MWHSSNVAIGDHFQVSLGKWHCRIFIRLWWIVLHFFHRRCRKWKNLQNLFCGILDFLSFHVKTVCGMEEDRQSPWVKRFAHKCFIFTTICIFIFTHICICLPWLKRSIQKCFIFTPTWWFLFVFAFAFVLVFSS